MNQLEELKGILSKENLSESLRIAFGRCPKCREGLAIGNWLKWCPNRNCQGYTGIK